MFPARVRVVTGIEAVSFGATGGVPSLILSCRVGLHTAPRVNLLFMPFGLRVSPPMLFTVVRDVQAADGSLL